jgi:REP element-mobilizing transposase RayT
MTGESDIGRKHLAHPPITDSHNEPVIIYLTVCSQDRKSIFAFEDSAAVIVDAWQRGNSWLVGRYVIMPDHIHLFCAPNGFRTRPPGAMGEILEESCVPQLAAAEESSHLAARLLGHAIAAT